MRQNKISPQEMGIIWKAKSHALSATPFPKDNSIVVINGVPAAALVQTGASEKQPVEGLSDAASAGVSAFFARATGPSTVPIQKGAGRKIAETLARQGSTGRDLAQLRGPWAPSSRELRYIEVDRVLSDQEVERFGGSATPSSPTFAHSLNFWMDRYTVNHRRIEDIKQAFSDDVDFEKAYARDLSRWEKSCAQAAERIVGSPLRPGFLTAALRRVASRYKSWWEEQGMEAEDALLTVQGLAMKSLRRFDRAHGTSVEAFVLSSVRHQFKDEIGACGLVGIPEEWKPLVLYFMGRYNSNPIRKAEVERKFGLTDPVIRAQQRNLVEPLMHKPDNFSSIGGRSSYGLAESISEEQGYPELEETVAANNTLLSHGSGGSSAFGVIDNDTRIDLMMRLELLNKEERELVELYFFQGLPPREIEKIKSWSSSKTNEKLDGLKVRLNKLAVINPCLSQQMTYVRRQQEAMKQRQGSMVGPRPQRVRTLSIKQQMRQTVG